MREMLEIERNLNRIGNDIRQAVAKNEDMALLRMMGRDYAHTQACIRNLKMMCSHLKRTRMKLDMAKTIDNLYSSVMGVVAVMSRMNETMNLPVMNRIINEYEAQTHMMNLTMDATEEMMTVGESSMIDEVGDEVVNKILDEFGVKAADSIAEAPRDPIIRLDQGVSNLEQRLYNLRT